MEKKAFEGRYARNEAMIGQEEQDRLANVVAAVVGLGGLGGHIAEQLARLGIGSLKLIDCDAVEESNLNRQLFATEATVGMAKTEAAVRRLALVNSSVRLEGISERLEEANALTLLSGAEIVFDAVDNVPTRLLLESACREMAVPLVHGAIGGWHGQVSFIEPGDDTLSLLYPKGLEKGAETKFGTPAFAPGLVASIQVAEGLKYLLGRGELLRRGLLRIDLQANSYTVLHL